MPKAPTIQPTPRQTARIGWNNRVQTVTIPLELRFAPGVREVFIRREGEQIILTPRPVDWSAFLALDARVDDAFMADTLALPVQVRSALGR